MFVGMLLPVVMPAQELSILPNGLSCYVTANKSSKGLADFALIRRDYAGNERVMNIDNVVTSSEITVDSTLLVLMKRVEADSTPADQAIIVCGDVDPASIINRLKYMSLMVEASASTPIPEYTWDGDGKIQISCLPDTLKGLSAVRCEWDAARTPFASMNTVQSAIYEKTVWEMGDLACRWIKRNLRNNNIPVAEVSFKHGGRTEGYSDECFVVEAVVALHDQEAAKREILAVLAALDAGRVGSSDLALAENAYLHYLERLSGRKVIDNGEYVQKCTDAFLYNSPLSSAKETLDYFRSKDVSADTRARIFTGITSALLNIEPQADTVAVAPTEIMLSDTLSLPGPGIKQKMRSSRKDPFSDGVVWTFDNGFKVIYKQMPTDRTLYYSLSLNGGLANIEDLDRGEGAYISDYLDNCWIAGMKGRDFKDLLNISGMTIDARVNLHNTVVSGQVKDRNVLLMMRGLLAVSQGCKVDTVSAKYYAESQKLRHQLYAGRDIRGTLDNLMCPGYRYTSFMTENGIQEKTFAKAENLFASLTSKMNDGVLVIVGDMSESDLKKLLQMYVGGFKVKHVASRRPAVQYHPVSGWLSYTVDGKRNASVVAVSGMLPMTASNYFATEIAAMVLERALKERFAGRNLSVNVSYSRSIYPDERFSVFVALEGMCGHDEVMAVRRVLADCSRKLDQNLLKVLKEYLKNTYALRMQSPGYWLREIPLRHLEGKDFTSGCAAKIDALTEGQIMSIFTTLEKGAGVEYIIKEKQ